MKDDSFTLPYSVRVADVNYGGHVSNAAVLNYFQDARIAYLAHLGPFTEQDIGGCGVILTAAAVRYRAEMFLGESLAIGVAVRELKRSTFTIGYRIERDGTVTAEGETQMAAFDYDSRRPRRIPEPFRDAILRRERHLATTSC